MIGYTPAQLVSSKVIQLGDHGSDRPTLFHESTHPLSPIPYPPSPIPYPPPPYPPPPSPHSFVTSSTTAWKVSIRASGVMP
jgi:hypothetical protein